ncbi:CusA/CzcA family heavy metal efflux RND transporter [Hymenobacter sp. BT683]|uniref:CusA/CzcA family heavy metal efflux RND transporter n=1 Tax=Hymenobacter jeongseonensis TaxID=2791027 RepID=A0ABS0INI9_9BACT|nr:CusA/CzcA family heavy metal efflux RND transporter [Hymenobacter jeongseonensis]MBF9239941.1 CusA/CzcA family heavy metal efflux RND transporter [Hymenobacter jeongseonensis]
MLSKIIAASIHNKLFVVLLVLTLIGWGGYSAVNLPLDAIPDVTNNQVQVLTQSPALAAQEVEQLLTVPLELQLRTIPGVTEIRSISRFGLSVITVVFDDEVPTLQTRQLVAEKLTAAQADLGGTLPQMAPITTGLGEIFQYTLAVKKDHKKQYSLAKLRDVQDWLVKRQLAGVPGVVEVSSFGGLVRQYEVSVNPDRLNAVGVSMPELFAALQNNNANTGGSYLERGPNAYFIRGEGRVNSLQDIGTIVIKQAAQNAPLLVRDVADVRFGHSARYGAMTRNGQGETVGGIVLMLKGASSEQTIKGVKTRVAEIQKSLPPGLEILPFLDRTKLIDKAIHTVSKNLLEGGVIVVLVLLLLLGNLRAGLVVASMIPLCMLFALGMMRTFGVSANLMSLGALDFGLIVDGAVIIVEAMIFHLVHFRAQTENETMDQVAETAATRMMRSALFGQLIILIVYFPILALSGIEGKMFRPMALTVSFAIVGAMLLCLTYVPAVSAWVLRKDIKEEGTVADRIMKFLYRGYRPLIAGALRLRVAVVAAAVGLLVLAGWLFTRMGGEFIPQLDEGDFAVNVTLAPGSSLSQSIATTTRIQQILLQNFPEIEQIVGKIGTSEIPTDPMAMEDSDQMIILKDQSEWTSAHSRVELADKMSAALAEVPGVNLEFQQPIQMRFNELISGAKSDISIKIYGDDLALLFEKATQAAALIRPLAGVGDLKEEQIAALPQLRVTYDRQKLAQYGLNVSDLNTLLRASFAGDVAGQVYEGERRYDLVVRLDSTSRQGLGDLRNLYVDTPTGQKIPLEEVAAVAYRSAPAQISRDDARRRINIGVNVRGRDVQSLVQEMQSKLDQGLKLPAGYTIKYGGAFENLQQAKARLSVVVPISLLLIFLLLYLSFNSLKQAALIFTGIPLATIGGILALWLRDMPFSISAGVGFIALFGVAVLNGIVLVASFNELALEGVKNVRERVLRATAERFRPVLLTAAVASLGFLPMALSTSAGAEVQKPLATVVIGGLITATLLTLLVLPVLYTFFTKDDEEAPDKGETPVAQTLIAPDAPMPGNHPTGAAPALALGLALLLLLPLGGFAQTTSPTSPAPTGPLTLAQALQTGLNQNLSVQSAALQVQQQRALTRTGYDIPRTVLDYQRGQISGGLIDQSFNIIQQTSLPGVYAAQRRLLESQALTAEQRGRVQRRELSQNIRSSYYQVLLSYRRAALLRRQDSLYRRAARAARIRYQVGETNRLEQVSAEARSQELQNRLATTLVDISVQQQQLALLLGTGTGRIDTLASVVAPLNAADTTALSADSNPALGLLRQQASQSQLQTRVEQLRRLPDVRVGYFNQSINKERGFQVVQAGISVPLLSGAQKGRVAAARIGEQVAENQLTYATTQLAGQAGQLRQQLRRARASLNYYEQAALPQARLILSTAEKSFRAGDIDYVTYVVNTEPAWQIQQAYLEQVSRYNEFVIGLQGLNGVE